MARRAGFCWGVRRAMDTALEASARFGHREPVQTLGPLIHNPQALDHLARRGVREVGEVCDLVRGSVVIRAHGVPLQDLNLLAGRRRQREIRIRNGTCPEVARVQSLIHRHASKGGFVIILGQPTHAEVLAHQSFATSGCAVIQTLEEADALPDEVLPGALVVAQTTFSVADFDVLTARLQARCPSVIVRRTICPDTFLRQDEARSLAASSDAVVVVGGKTSNNTRHLVEIAREACPLVHWVESAKELRLPDFAGVKDAAVLAGASTPNWTVEEVVEALESVGRPSRVRWLLRLTRTLRVPESLLFGLLTGLLHRLLGWSTGWAGPLLPIAFHLAVFALAPYVDPFGLDAKGQTQGHFLAKQRPLLWGVGGLSTAGALLAAGAFGPWAVAGTLVCGALVLAYRRIPIPRFLRLLPGQRDLALSVLPVWLGVGLPLFRHPVEHSARLGLSAFALFGFALAFHALCHLRAFREDRVLGKEVLSVAIGSRMTQWVAAGLLIGSFGAVGWMLR